MLEGDTQQTEVIKENKKWKLKKKKTKVRGKWRMKKQKYYQSIKLIRKQDVNAENRRLNGRRKKKYENELVG